MDQLPRTSIKEANTEGEENGRAGRPGEQRKRNRSGSGSSRSTSRSSSGDRSGPGKNKTKSKGNKSSPVSPYLKGNSAQRQSNKEERVQDGNRTNTNRKQENGVPRNNSSKNNNVNNNNTKNNNVNNNVTHRIYSRPTTSGPRLQSDPDRGYDNSERNPNRRNLGSSTDQVADQRPIFGPWRQPDAERQRLLVERLAPAKPPAPPDPRFNHWKNHFLYYWHIGLDPRPRRAGHYGSSSASPRRYQHSEVAYSQNGYDHRLLKRPKTTSGRIRGDNNNNNNNTNMRLDLTNHPFTGSASVDGRHGMAQRGTQSAREYSAGDSPRVVSGLDRRYMGLQAVSNTQMQDIVDRLTKMTSAYNAKFAPNPHVWVDTEPGAHMVKRTNTTLS